jgi:phage shock protein PspC (stress-responsive transcriptional regulator)
MQKVVIINLNGRACQLDEGAYDSLRAYLARAEAALAKNPDKLEIIADLEQAIAEKCDRFLGPTKNVVTLAEINQVIEEMGPVHDSTADEAARAGAAAEPKETPRVDPDAPRRLYRVREGALIAGVCNGLAAFLNIDVTVVRLIFVLLTVVSSGVVGLGYIVLMFVLPEANTSEEQAAARGMPFNAQELIDRVKQSAKIGEGSNAWFGGWDTGHAARRRAERRMHRERIRAKRYAAAYGEGQVDYAGQVLAGIFVPIASIISAALFVGLILAIISLVKSGTIFGWVVLVPMPLWAQILMLVLAYHLIAWPLHVISHGPMQRDGTGRGWIAMWGGILWLGFAAVFLWFAYQGVPGFREFIDNFPESLSEGINQGLRVTLKLIE